MVNFPSKGALPLAAPNSGSDPDNADSGDDDIKPNADTGPSAPGKLGPAHRKKLTTLAVGRQESRPVLYPFRNAAPSCVGNDELQMDWTPNIANIRAWVNTPEDAENWRPVIEEILDGTWKREDFQPVQPDDQPADCPPISGSATALLQIASFMYREEAESLAGAVEEYDIATVGGPSLCDLDSNQLNLANAPGFIVKMLVRMHPADEAARQATIVFHHQYMDSLGDEKRQEYQQNIAKRSADRPKLLALIIYPRTDEEIQNMIWDRFFSTHLLDRRSNTEKDLAHRVRQQIMKRRSNRYLQQRNLERLRIFSDFSIVDTVSFLQNPYLHHSVVENVIEHNNGDEIGELILNGSLTNDHLAAILKKTKEYMHCQMVARHPNADGAVVLAACLRARALKRRDRPSFDPETILDKVDADGLVRLLEGLTDDDPLGHDTVLAFAESGRAPDAVLEWLLQNWQDADPDWNEILNAAFGNLSRRNKRAKQAETQQRQAGGGKKGSPEPLDVD